MLALEGGGDKGAYEAGALKAFVELLPPKEIEYDVITGVSVGAINAMAIALHEKGNEKQCVNMVNNLWLNMTSNNIYSNWRFGLVEGISVREGLYDNSNEKAFLQGVFDENFPDKIVYREIEWNAIDFDSAEVVRFNKKETWDSIPVKIVASTSMPFAFPHLHLDNKTYVDGGVVWNIDIAAGINRCLENGFKENNIIVDAILCTGKRVLPRGHDNSYNTLQNYMRMRDIKSYYNSMSDIDEIKRGYNNVKFRHLIIPQEPLPSGYIPLGFKHDDIVQMIKLGYEEATEAIKKKGTSSFDEADKILAELYSVYNPEVMQNFRPMRIKSSY